MTPLAEACGSLQTCLPEAAVLVGQPDTDGTTGHGKPGSRPPWNPAAANAVYDVHTGIRRLHIQLHAEVTGQALRYVPAAAHATGAHIRAVMALSASVSHGSATDAAHVIASWVMAIQQLPAVDEAERFIKVAGVACLHCGSSMLRLGERSGRLTCLRYGACCDHDGQHPVGFVAHSVNGEPMIAWADGCNQYAQVQP